MNMLVCGNLARSRLQVLGPTYPTASCFYSSLAHSPSYQPSISQTTHSGTYVGMGSSEQRRGLSIYVDGKEVHTRDLVPSGVMAVYKPIGWTSQDVCARIKTILTDGIVANPDNLKYMTNARGIVKRPVFKIGHGGTLDPNASGVLVIGIGTGTKVMSKYLEGSKSYLAQGKVGFETDSQDRTGSMTIRMCEARPDGSRGTDEFIYDANEKEPDYPCTVPRSLVRQVLDQFRGEISQVPPMFSALKKDGRRLYELARQGRIVHREKRSITIYDLHQVDRISLSPDTRISANVIEGGLTDADVEDDAALPLFNIHLTCSGGTYVRTLMQDIARACGARAHITVLERTKVGPYTIDDCLFLSDWTHENILKHIHDSTWKHSLLAASSGAAVGCSDTPHTLQSDTNNMNMSTTEFMNSLYEDIQKELREKRRQDRKKRHGKKKQLQYREHGNRDGHRDRDEYRDEDRNRDTSHNQFRRHDAPRGDFRDWKDQNQRIRTDIHPPRPQQFPEDEIPLTLLTQEEKQQWQIRNARMYTDLLNAYPDDSNPDYRTRNSQHREEGGRGGRECQGGGGGGGGGGGTGGSASEVRP